MYFLTVFNLVHDFFYVFLFILRIKNPAPKTCQSLALIGNLMPLLTWKVKSHLKKKFLNIVSFRLRETSVLTKVKLSSLVWKIRHFKGQFLVLASPIAKSFPQFTPFMLHVPLHIMKVIDVGGVSLWVSSVCWDTK